ncbi:LacI family DNA-binding transcriptional regulator [Agromyces soli]
MPSSVTLSEVAAAAGVSVATASRALSGKNRVAVATIERVRTAAAELGYRVDPIARALREGSTRIVGMIVPVIGNPYFAQLVDAVEHELHRGGFELLLADSHGELAEEAKRLTVFGDRKVDGIVIVPSDRIASAAAVRAIPAGTSVVQIDRSAGTSLADFVGVDNEIGIALALDHLAERGARSLVYVGADDLTSSGVERWTAFDHGVDRERFAVDAPIRGDFSVATGAAAADALLARGPLPDAVVTAGDLIAIGLIARLREHGVEVPRDLLVTGFDGTELSQLLSPTITTVVQPIDAIAADAIAFLTARIAGSDAPVRRSRVAPSLLPGGSTAR